MTLRELNSFLTASRSPVKIATVDQEGWPMVNPAWYVYEDARFYIVTKERAGFCRNLRREPRTTLLLDNPEPPYKRVTVRGVAEFVDEDWRERARQMTLRYLGPDGFGYYNATLELPRQVIRVRPVKISTWNGAGIDRTFFADTIWRDVTAAEREGGPAR